jgi:uncharacterized membrane protein SpoIIM required for sporulation
MDFVLCVVSYLTTILYSCYFNGYVQDFDTLIENLMTINYFYASWVSFMSLVGYVIFYLLILYRKELEKNYEKFFEDIAKACKKEKNKPKNNKFMIYTKTIIFFSNFLLMLTFTQNIFMVIVIANGLVLSILIRYKLNEFNEIVQEKEFKENHLTEEKES